MTYDELRRRELERKWELERRQQPVLHYTDNGWMYIKKLVRQPERVCRNDTEKHEEYKARLLQEVGDIITAEVDGKKLPICTLSCLSVRRAFGKTRKKGETHSK